MKNYKVINGISFDEKTPQRVCEILSNAYNTKTRIRVFYGDPETGTDWNEEYSTIGTVGRSTGQYKIPLLISNSRSYGGGSILDHCIVKITIDKKTVYQHPKYNTAQITTAKNRVLKNGEVYANCKNENTALRLAEFLTGNRNSK